MYSPCTLLQSILSTSGSNIALVVPIPLHSPIRTTDHHIVPYIKLSPLVKQWFFYIFLQYISLQSSITMFLLFPQNCLNLINIQAHYYPITSIGVLPWFYYPCIVLMNAIAVLPNRFTNRIVSLTELQVLVVLKTLLYMEGQRQVVKYIFAYFRVVLTHCCKQGFLVSYYEVIN